MTIADLDATTIAARIAAGGLSAEGVAQALLARIAERGPVVNAFAAIDPDAVLRAARVLDAATHRGPLHGVPMAVKDVLDTADLPTAMGSPIFAGHRPRADAACVALARAAGALVLGKTVTAEFAYVHPGPTTNPHNPAHTPGGSSSGSAAAVAAGMVPLALGTQTGGSVLRPAACGLLRRGGLQAELRADPSRRPQAHVGKPRHHRYLCPRRRRCGAAAAGSGGVAATSLDGRAAAAHRAVPVASLAPGHAGRA